MPMNFDRFLDPQFVTAWLWIIVIDVVLSGDNAVVIAMAAHRLPTRQRRLAMALNTSLSSACELCSRRW